MMKFKEILKEKLEKLAIYIIIGLTIIFAISLVRNILRLRKVNISIQEKKENIERLKAESKDLENTLEKIKSNEHIEEKLRNDLGYVKEGETVIILPDADTVKKLAPKAETIEESLPKPNWQLWLDLFK